MELFKFQTKKKHIMTLTEIKQALKEGKRVFLGSLAYEVKFLDSKQDYYIVSNKHSIGLTWTDGVTLNGKETDFFIK